MKKRDEIEEKYKTDLTIIFKSDKEAFESMEKLKNMVDDLSKYENKVLSSSDTFYKFIKLYEDYSKLMNKVYIYYYFKYDLDLTNTSIKEKLDLLENLRISFAEKLSFINIELSKITLNKWNAFKNENKNLEVYDYYIKDIIRYKKHKLKPVYEKFITKLYPVFGSNESIYEILTNADAKFDSVIVSGKLEELNEGNLRVFLLNKDREVRHNAYMNILKYYESHKYTISELYKRFIKESNTINKLNKFNNTLESEMFESNLSVKIYDNLISFVKSKSEINKRIIRLFKSELGYKEIYPYDMYYTEINANKYSFEDGVKEVSNALSVLGSEYISIFEEGIKNRWIDVYPSLHKNSMQYNIASAGVSPLVHLNYNDSYDDISTLAHEMGHAIHHYLSNKYCETVYADATILATEVASLTNEMLLSNYILKNSKDDKEKLFILNQIMQSIKGVVFNQVLLAEFESICSRLDSEGEILSLDRFTLIYNKLLNEYNGSEINYVKNQEYSWMRIPHLYAGNGFYVYKYAIDFLIASGVAKNIIDGNDEVRSKYLEFLKCGSSKPDVVLFKDLGFDITKNKYMIDAFKLYDEYINMYESLLKKVKNI